MRIVIILLSFAAIGFAADVQPQHPDVNQLKAEYDTKVKELNEQFAKRIVAYRDANFTKAQDIKASPDPKKSETDARELVSHYNQEFSGLDHAIQDGGWPRINDALSSLMISEEYAQKLEKLGINVRKGHTETVAQVTQEAKPKDKKKITATLSDGTKVGE